MYHRCCLAKLFYKLFLEKIPAIAKRFPDRFQVLKMFYYVWKPMGLWLSLSSQDPDRISLVFGSEQRK